MSRVRTAAVAGQFYEGDSKRLQDNVDAMLLQAKTDAPCPKVLVAPHAGLPGQVVTLAAAFEERRDVRQSVLQKSPRFCAFFLSFVRRSLLGTQPRPGWFRRSLDLL